MRKLTSTYILEILKNHSDEEHRLSNTEIQKLLESEYEQKVEYRTVGRHLDTLSKEKPNIKYSVRKRKNNSSIRHDWYLPRERDELTDSELRLLIDGLLFSKHGKWGRLLTKQDRDEEAEAYYKKAIEFSERICEQRTKYPAANQKRLLVSYDNMGAHCMKTGRIEEDGEYYQKSLIAREERYRTWKTAENLRFLAMSYENMSRYFKALKEQQQEREF